MSEVAGETKKGQGLFYRIFSSVPPAQKERFEAARLDTNVTRMYAFSIYVVAIQILLNLLNILRPGDDKAHNIEVYVILSMATLVIGAIYWFLLRRVRKKGNASHKMKRALVESLLYIYIVIQMVFCTLNVMASGGANSYIIAILIIGLFPVLPPAQSILSILICAVYLVVAMYLARDVSSTWDTVLLTDTWTNLIIITGLIVCISVFIYRMYVENFLKSVNLQVTNKSLQDANELLERMVTTDAMTGVSNRYALSKNFDDVWNASSLKEQKIAVALFDIDFFKAYNDTFGHLEGDQCLQKIAESLQSSFRRHHDVVYRFGGEEFLILFAATEEEAFEQVEKARINIENLKIKHATDTVSPFVTVSAGICIVAPQGNSSIVSTNRALKIADDALYESKSNGRNRTTMKNME